MLRLSILPNPLRNRGIDPNLIDVDAPEQAEETFDDAPDSDSIPNATGTVVVLSDLS